MGDITVLGVPLWVILLCGVLGVLIDLDHPIAYYRLNKSHSRFLHTPILIISGCIFFISLSCIGGLLYKAVLSK